MHTAEVLILAPSLEPYLKMLGPRGLNGRVITSVPLLNQTLVEEQPCCGLILDMHMVMAAATTDRDRLFDLAAGKLPVVRAKTDSCALGVRLLDDISSIESKSSGTGANYRLEQRVVTDLKAEYSHPNDPVMSRSTKARILDLSCGGCFLSLQGAKYTRDYLYIRIPELNEQRPIHCGVRWRGNGPGGEPGLGLKFIDASEAQVKRIREKVEVC